MAGDPHPLPSHRHTSSPPRSPNLRWLLHLSLHNAHCAILIAKGVTHLDFLALPGFSSFPPGSSDAYENGDYDRDHEDNECESDGDTGPRT